MLIAFSELAGIFNLDREGRLPFVNEPLGLVMTLARRHPEHTFVVINRVRTGKNPLPASEFPPNLGLLFTPAMLRKRDTSEVAEQAANFAVTSVDRYIVLTGVLFPSGHPNVPKLARPDQMFKPLDMASRTQWPVTAALNAWSESGRDPVFIVNDPRSMLRCRDLKWPPRRPILAQHRLTRKMLHYRFGDPRSPLECGYDPELVQWSAQHAGYWVAAHEYIPSRYEIFASSLTTGAPSEVLA